MNIPCTTEMLLFQVKFDQSLQCNFAIGARCLFPNGCNNLLKGCILFFKFIRIKFKTLN